MGSGGGPEPRPAQYRRQPREGWLPPGSDFFHEGARKTRWSDMAALRGAKDRPDPSGVRPPGIGRQEGGAQ
jgi:hypothetical protein